MQMNSNDNNEISDLFFIFKKHLRPLLIIPICSSILAILITTGIAPKWEATRTIQIGQVKSAKNIELIEPVAVALTRVTNKSFLNEIVHKLHSSKKNIKLFETTFEANQKRGTNLIEVKASASSPEAARELIELTTDQLLLLHKSSMEPLLDTFKGQQLSLSENKKRIEKEIEILNNKLSNLSRKNSPELIFNVLTLQNKFAEIKEINQQLALLSENLNSMGTFPSRIIGETSVSEPITPQKPIIALVVYLLATLIILGALSIKYSAKKSTTF